MKPIRDVLTGRSPLTLSPSATVLEAARAMQSAHVGAVFVLDGERLVGCFTERDVVTRVVVPGLDATTVRLEEVMTRELFTVTPEARIREVAREMQSRHVRHVPVVEDDRLIAVVGLRDLLREHLQDKRAEVRQLTEYIRGNESAG